MIRNLLATTAFATLIATGAMAQTATQPAPAAPAEVAPAAPGAVVVTPASGHLATNLIGENVYNGTGDDAQSIGDVNDIVIGQDGNVEAVVVGVGGFLGIGEKNVAVDYKTVDWAEKNGDRWLVVNTTKEALQAQAEFDRTPFDPSATVAATDPATPVVPAAPADQSAMKAPAPAEPAAADQTAANAPATAEQPAATTPDKMATAAIDKSTLKEMAAGDIRAEDLVGTTVYGANDANVGEIGDVVLTADGKVDSIIIDVGGFLGIGEKEVAVGMDNLAFMTDGNGNRYLYTNFTEEQLNAQAAYDKNSWAEKRDEQRLIYTR